MRFTFFGPTVPSAMEPVNTVGAISLLGQTDCTAQSIVKALDNFLRAVQQMREVVMVPSRLKDMTPCPVADKKTSKALMPWTPAPGCNGTPMSKLDLFNCYSMLYSIRNELVCGADCSTLLSVNYEMPADRENQKPLTEAEEQAVRLASAFRQHMHGLFTILGQLTDTANYLSKKYQDDVDGLSKK